MKEKLIKLSKPFLLTEIPLLTFFLAGQIADGAVTLNALNTCRLIN